mgnify:CR=1 FL=1
MGELRPIEGGRAIAARDVQASFAVDTDEITTSIPNIAGYVIMAWDDEGSITDAYHLGTRNPMCHQMILDLFKSRFSGRVIGNGD